jgi:hypothetical protein
MAGHWRQARYLPMLPCQDGRLAKVNGIAVHPSEFLTISVSKYASKNTKTADSVFKSFYRLIVAGLSFEKSAFKVSDFPYKSSRRHLVCDFLS